MKEIAQEELTTEQLEKQEEKEIREKLNAEIQRGIDMERLKNNPAFKSIFLELFLAQGKSILWENIKHLTEGQMIGKGSDKNLQVIEELKRQVHVRLDLEGFINAVENDAATAKRELEIMNQEAEEAAKAAEAEAKGE